MNVSHPGLAREAVPAVEPRPIRTSEVEVVRPAADRPADAEAAARAREARRAEMERFRP